jgi:hypothetical protein
VLVYTSPSFTIFVVTEKEPALFIATVKSRGRNMEIRVSNGDRAASGFFGFAGGQYTVISSEALPVFEIGLPGVL